MFVRLVRFSLGEGKHKVAQNLAGKLVPAISFDGMRWSLTMESRP